MKKSRLMRKGTICEFTHVWVAAVFGLLQVGFGGDRSTPGVCGWPGDREKEMGNFCVEGRS
ncbi:hypothetical protein H0E87_012540 [Populus deltoides]|uniref:Uncharacterized protein n=1 Tax=Populus deltoides TaxID=3696 RepID=A0A8T2YJV4_POPDE|nr:hypothetical protein H0E87_012540 [Populus deltoides]